MIVAREKRKKNVAEYVLYMWQIEDTLRAMNFDMELIEQKLISKYNQPVKVIDEIRDWYSNIIVSMHEEGIMKSGHLNVVKSLINEMFELHERIKQEIRLPDYLEIYKKAKPNIEAFSEKLQKDGANEIEVCFYGLYGLLLLRLKKKDITQETEDAMKTFSNLLGILSLYFNKMDSGSLEF